MKNKYLIFLSIVIFLILRTNTTSEEFNLKSNKIEILDSGNKIEAIGNVEITTDNNIQIKSNESFLDKSNSILISKGDVILYDKIKNIKIIAQYIKYDKKKGELFVDGKSKTIVDEKFTLISTNIFFDTINQVVYSKFKSLLEDDLGNKLSFSEFHLDIDKEILKVKNLSLNDAQNNKFLLKEAAVNLKKIELIGKDVKIFFDKSTLGNKDNNPRLFGNAVSDNQEKTKIEKGVFTTCKIRENDKCPPWLIRSEEVIHDKKKRIIEYKNAWLNIYDFPVLYFPYLSHPDPTVKRQSGFLIPSFNNSNTLGSSLQIPYYKVLSENKDITFSPRLFFDDKKLLQTEYRQVDKDLKTIFDHSINVTKDGNDSHFFGNILKINENHTFTMNFQTTSNRTYLKKYELDSPLISNYSYLNSYFEFEKISEYSLFNLNFEIFEDLSKDDSDAYEYIYPNYTYAKNINTNLLGNLTFNSSGYQKKYDTNKYEGLLINDIKYSSLKNIKESGFVNNYSLILKNVNLDGEGSDQYGNEYANQILTSFNYNTSYPLFKKLDESVNFLTPKISLRYSPTQTKNINRDDKRIDYVDLFGDNRINRSDTLEGGESLTAGIDYTINNEKKRDLLNISAGQVFRFNENKDLPEISSIGDKRSDIIGKMSFRPNENFNLNYSFLVDENLNNTNFNFIETGLSVNNFITNFSYLESNSIISERSYISNETKIKLNNNFNLGFSVNKNLDQNLTEYYDIIYEYKNDCLIAAIEYKKSFYKDTDFEPAENIFFSIKLLPFGDTGSQSIN